ncbi:MAG: hypothetical protein L0956_05745 [Candidatus Mariimomonas ferrooxydans]
MTEGVVEKWLKKDGALVSKGEEIVEISTDKVTTPIECPKDGILQILVESGTTVPAGEIIGEVIDKDD